MQGAVLAKIFHDTHPQKEHGAHPKAPKELCLFFLKAEIILWDLWDLP